MVRGNMVKVNGGIQRQYTKKIKISRRFYAFLFVSSIAIIMCSFFEADYSLPLSASLTLFSAVVLFGIWKIKLSHYSFLTRAMLLIYTLPFIHSFQYLWDKNIYFTDYVWGLKANPYQLNLAIIKKMTMVGCIGAFGLVAGYLLAGLKRKKRTKMLINGSKALNLPCFLLIAAVAIFLSWINAPKETILVAAYATSARLLHGINFNGAWMLSYIFIILLLIDIFNESVPKIRVYKSVITLIVFVVIVFYFQLLRGDRECAGMIIGFIVLYILAQASMFRFTKKKFIAIFCTVIIFFLLGQVVGQVRTSSWFDNRIVMPDKFKIIRGTWSAVLLTPLSVIGDFHHHLMRPRWGRTYWDYFLSLPPGVLTQLIGIERPIESTRGPAWAMRYGLGGTHAMVVPFMNFKSFGVFLVLLLYGLLLGRLEMKMQTTHNTKIKLLYGSFFVLAPFWFWYGDMNLIRGIMAFYLVWFTYKLLPKHRGIMLQQK